MTIIVNQVLRIKECGVESLLLHLNLLCCNLLRLDLFDWMQNAVSCMKANRVHMHGLFGSLATTWTQFNKWVLLAFILLICQIAILLLILVM